MHHYVYLACVKPEGGVDGQMLQLLSTTFSIDDLADIIEMQKIHDSWRAAAEINQKREQDRRDKQRRRGR